MTLHHGSLPESTHIHIKRLSRAAARGRGPPSQASELPFLRLVELADDAAPLVQNGPCHPKRLAIIASWWALREIEAANATLESVAFSADTAQLTLPSSKTDTAGRGATRSLGCTCASAMAALCPFHNLKSQVEWATTQAQTSGRTPAGYPLFPTTAGVAAAKKQMSATVVAIAIALGLLVNGITGAQRFSGHTFRVTGAMYLASCGIDVWRIQLHCRWGSNSVLRYVRLAPLSGSVALEASLGRDLKHVETAIVAAKAELAVAKSTLTTQPSLRESRGGVGA